MAIVRKAHLGIDEVDLDEMRERVVDSATAALLSSLLNPCRDMLMY